ncbi:MAG TPA: hypothetical protein VE825_04020 [Terriglobales bacterium]|nr:hypothetical protein [Terriglobales bacterium]
MDQFFLGGGGDLGEEEEVAQDSLHQEPEESGEEELLVAAVRLDRLSGGAVEHRQEDEDGRQLGRGRDPAQREGEGSGRGQLRRHARRDAGQHQVEAQVGQLRPPQGGVLEARERLVGEAHHEQTDPAEDHGVGVGVDRRQQAQLQEAFTECDLRQVHRAPERAHRQHDGDARLEEAAVDVVRERLPVDLAGQVLRPLGLGIQFLQQALQVHLVDGGKEGERLGGAVRSATAVQPVLIEDPAGAGDGLYDLGHAGVLGDDHGFLPKVLRLRPWAMAGYDFGHTQPRPRPWTARTNIRL